MLNICWKPKGQMWITWKCLPETNNGKRECNNDFFFNGDLTVLGRKKMTLKYIYIKGGKLDSWIQVYLFYNKGETNIFPLELSLAQQYLLSQKWGFEIFI